jgi:TetR/AcrR family fatty acid metabolism transcriptional regulator
MSLPGRKKSQEKQAQILRAASEVFAAKDFHQVLMEEVAARAGVGKGTLYRYFPAKEDLYFATIFAGMDQLRGEIGTLASRAESLAEILEAVAAGILRFFWLRRPLLSLIHQYEVRLRGPQGTEWLARRAAIAQMIADIFARAVAAGEIGTVEPRLAAELFLGMVRSANVYRTERDDPESLGREIAWILMNGLRNGHGR